MKFIYAFWVLAIFSITALNDALKPHCRIHGKNGWYVPERDGSFYWMGKATFKKWRRGIKKYDRHFFRKVVNFYLFTQSNLFNGMEISATEESIRRSNFNPSNPTRIVIHGWTGSSSTESSIVVKDAWLHHGDFNVIVVDWPSARSTYLFSVLSVPMVGKKVADMINYLVSDHGMSLNDLYIIGHSLGAHVAGYAGKNTRGQVHSVIGLDPALPLFFYEHSHRRLSADDGYYVESIQTNGGFMGFLKPIGKATFYPNGGETQPGCNQFRKHSCSHARSWQYYAEAIRQNGFLSVRCDDYQEAVENRCDNTYSDVLMGANANVKGIFYVPVRSRAPFGMKH